GVAGAGAERDHDDDRGHADEDAEDGEARAELGPGDGAEGDPDGGKDAPHFRDSSGGSSSTGGSSARAAWASWRAALMTSLRTRPSRMVMTRLAQAAMSGSCVTRQMVMPWFSLRSWRRAS